MPLQRRTLLATLLVAAASSLAAQGRVGCASGAPIATLGTLELDCVQCTIHASADRWIEYGAEPTVKRSTGGSDGFRAGDVIVSIDGALITTSAGSRRLASPNPDRPSNVMVRRDGKQLLLSIAPQLRCPVNVVVRGAQADTVVAVGGFARGSTWAVAPARVGRVQDDSEARAPTMRSGTARAVYTGDTVNYIARRSGDVVAPTAARAGGVGGAAVARRVDADSMAPRMAGGVARPTMMADSTSRPRFATGTAGRLAWQFDSTAPVSARAAAAGRGGFMGTAEPPAASGWLGFGLDCSNCTAQTTADGRRVWHFSAAPSIAGIEPGSPAELAGLEVGDVLREVDGVSLTWPAGAARFSAIKPGQKVKLTIVRKGKQMEVTMTARARGTRT